jgi:hypothetical protein
MPELALQRPKFFMIKVGNSTAFGIIARCHGECNEDWLTFRFDGGFQAARFADFADNGCSPHRRRITDIHPVIEGFSEEGLACASSRVVIEEIFPQGRHAMEAAWAVPPRTQGCRAQSWFTDAWHTWGYRVDTRPHRPTLSPFRGEL